MSPLNHHIMVTKQSPAKKSHLTGKNAKASPRWPWANLLLISATSVFVIFTGLFIYFKWQRSPAIANFLPAQQTLALVQLDTALADRYYPYLSTLLPDNQWLPQYSRLRSWLGNTLGVAFVQNDSSPAPILFLSFTDEDQALSFIKSQTIAPDETFQKSTYREFPIYTPSLQPWVATIIDNYAILAPRAALITQVVDVYLDPAQSLRRAPDYINVTNKLAPERSLAYLNYTLWDNALWPNSLTELKLLLSPLPKLISALGVSLSSDTPQKLNLYFLARQKEALAPLMPPTTYSGDLLAYLPADYTWQSGGTTPLTLLNGLIEVFRRESPSLALLLKNNFDDLFINYLGYRYNLEQVTALLNIQEWAIARRGSQFVAVLDFPDSAALPTVLESMRKYSQFLYHPIVQNFLLPDGSTGQELVADPQLIKESSTTIADQSVTTWSNQSGPILYYIVKDRRLFLTNVPDEMARYLNGTATHAVPAITGDLYTAWRLPETWTTFCPATTGSGTTLSGSGETLPTCLPPLWTTIAAQIQLGEEVAVDINLE